MRITGYRVENCHAKYILKIVTQNISPNYPTYMRMGGGRCTRMIDACVGIYGYRNVVKNNVSMFLLPLIYTQLKNKRDTSLKKWHTSLLVLSVAVTKLSSCGELKPPFLVRVAN